MTDWGLRRCYRLCHKVAMFHRMEVELASTCAMKHEILHLQQL